jgi:hypothetical protein
MTKISEQAKYVVYRDGVVERGRPKKISELKSFLPATDPGAAQFSHRFVVAPGGYKTVLCRSRIRFIVPRMRAPQPRALGAEHVRQRHHRSPKPCSQVTMID